MVPFPVSWRKTIFSDCTHVFSGIEGGASVPLGSVHSMAYFSSVPEGSLCWSVQTVAVRLTGGGFFLLGTVKFTIAVQDIGSIVASTIHLSDEYGAMNLQKPPMWKIRTTSNGIPLPNRTCNFAFWFS